MNQDKLQALETSGKESRRTTRIMRKLRVGVIGANPARSWAVAAHLPALRALPMFEISAVSTRRQESANEAARLFGAELAFSDPFALVRSPRVDVVSVCVKVPDHFDLVMAALSEGKHVFCEWPLGANTEQAEAMLELARRKHVRHMVGLQGRGSPTVNHLKNLASQGYVGRVLSCTALCSNPLFGATISRDTVWYTDRRNGANVMTIGAGHSLDLICYCLGEFQALSAVVAIQYPRPVVGETGEVVENSSPDQIAIAGILESGAVVSAHTQAGNINATGFQLEINGTDGDLQMTSTGKFANIGPQASELLLRGRQRLAHAAISEAGTLSGDTGAAALDLLTLPEDCLPAYLANIPAGPARNVAQLYVELANAIENDRDTTVGFDLAVRRHRLLDIIQSASDSGQRKSILDPD